MWWRGTISLANSYMKACLGIAYDRSNIVDLALALWMNNEHCQGRNWYGCGVVSFKKGAIEKIERWMTSWSYWQRTSRLPGPFSQLLLLISLTFP